MVEDDEILEEEVVETDEPISEEEPEIELGENKEDAVDVQIQEGPVEDMEPEEPEQNFYANLAEEMDDTTLARLSSELISDFKKDKESRSDWEKSYISGLDLLGFKNSEDSKPFMGASSVTHPLLAESVTQFQAQAYKELLPARS